MVTKLIRCCYCNGEHIKKNGFAPNGKQKYRCKGCGKASRENPSPKGYSETRREEILRAYEERSSLRGLSRTFGVSRTTVTKWLKKSQNTTAPKLHSQRS
jgi:transposase-like protein